MSGFDKQKIVSSVPKGFFGHPKGLFTLFFTEFWECCCTGTECTACEILYA
jgi:hypothetical protein